MTKKETNTMDTLTVANQLDEEKQSSIICFQHCDDGCHVSCFKVPAKCPLCKRSLQNTGFVVPPFCLPSPFQNTAGNEMLRQHKPYCCFLIKPTNGDFFSSYKSGDNLHIGIADSEGNVFSYDENGVQVEDNSWKNCLAIEILTSKNGSVSVMWNSKLVSVSEQELWRKDLYNEESHNCYSFALQFLNELLTKKFSKAEFCERFILPVTKRAAEYIGIYRKILNDGYFIHEKV